MRDEKVIPLQEAVRRLSGLPATNLELEGRGFIREGMFADVVVFDPRTIADRATFEKPHQYAVGMRHVFVNGTQVLKDGEHTGAKPGRALWGPGRNTETRLGVTDLQSREAQRQSRVPVIIHPMRIEHHDWYSPRLGHDMGVAVFGHWGPPLLAFPTSHGDEWELHRQGLIGAVGDFIEARPRQGLLRRLQQPGVVPEQAARTRSIAAGGSGCSTNTSTRRWSRSSTPARQSPDIAITTMGASLGAYHAANTLFRYPHQVKRCYGLSGIYDLREFMDGIYDDNFYFHNPVDYVANLSDPWV